MMVTHNTGASRFESGSAEDLAVAAYILGDDVMTFTHTKVPTHLEGRGVGGELAQFGLEYARDNGLKVVPQCPFIAHYMSEHPEFASLR